MCIKFTQGTNLSLLQFRQDHLYPPLYQLYLLLKKQPRPLLSMRSLFLQPVCLTCFGHKIFNAIALDVRDVLNNCTRAEVFKSSIRKKRQTNAKNICFAYVWLLSNNVIVQSGPQPRGGDNRAIAPSKFSKHCESTVYRKEYISSKESDTKIL